MENELFFAALGVAGGSGLHWYITKHREHSTHPKSAPDLVNWDHLAGNPSDGIIRLKGGGLLVSYQYRGQDMASAEASHRTQLSYQLNQIFKDIESGWAFYLTNCRYPAKGYPSSEAFPDPVSWALDQERRKSASQEGKHFRSRLYLSIIWKPEFEAEPEDFLSQLHDLETNLSEVLSIKRLSAEEHLSFLYESTHGIRQPVTALSPGEPVDTLLANQEIQVLPVFDSKQHPVRSKLGIPSDYVVIDGDRYICCISITGYPEESFNGVIQDLNTLGFQYRWTTRFITMSRPLQEKKISRIREKYRLSRLSGGKIMTSTMNDGSGGNQRLEDAYEDKHALNMMEDASDALQELQERSTGFGMYTSTIVLNNPDYEQLKWQTDKVLSCLRKAGYTGTIERWQPLPAWLGSLPGHGVSNIRKEFISTYNLADTIPSWNMFTGLEKNPSQYMEGAEPHYQAKTIDREPYSKHNPSSGDVGHKIITGATGAGKSVFVNFELAQWLRHPNAQVFLLDRGYTGYLLCEAVGGSHYDLLSDEDIAFQPLRDIDDPGYQKWVIDWIKRLLQLQECKVTPTDERKVILPAIRSLAKEPHELRTLTTLKGQIQDQKIRDALAVYCREGAYGHILDASSDSFHNSRYQVFETETLMEYSDEIVLPVLDYIFHRIERSLATDRPTMIYIEEAWSAFDHPLFSQRIKSWLLTLRKYNGHVALVTHNPSQLDELDNPQLFTESAPERVFLPNPDATKKGTREYYYKLGLNEAQTHIVSRLKKKKHYYLYTPNGSNVIDLDLDPLALSLLTDPSGDSVDQRKARIRRLKQTHGEQWPIYWLREIGQEDQAEALRQAYQNFTDNPNTSTNNAEVQTV